MKKLIIMNGYPKAGKDTIILCMQNILRAFGTTSINVSMIDPTSEMLSQHRSIDPNFLKEKSPAARQLLASVHRALLDNTDAPIEGLFQVDPEIEYVFSCCREPDTIDRLKAAAKDRGYMPFTVLVNRDNHLTPTTEADAKVEQYQYDITVDNNGPMTEVTNIAATILASIEILEETYEDHKPL